MDPWHPQTKLGVGWVPGAEEAEAMGIEIFPGSCLEKISPGVLEKMLQPAWGI